MHQTTLSQPEQNTTGELALSMRTLSIPCDEALVKSAQHGTATAYAELCRRHQPMIYRAVHRITKNREDTEDALQDACMRGYMHIGQFDGRSAFSTWLTRIAINSALMTMRKRRRYNETYLDDHFSSDSRMAIEIAEPSKNPEDIVIDRERQLLVRKAVSRLPARLRTVVEIRHSQDCSIDEIARIAGISVAATKSRLLRARNTLSRPLGRMHKEITWQKSKAS